jgi:hypothetical protein
MSPRDNIYWHYSTLFHRRRQSPIEGTRRRFSLPRARPTKFVAGDTPAEAAQAIAESVTLGALSCGMRPRLPSVERMPANCLALSPLACRQSARYILNYMVQYAKARLDTSFAALSDAPDAAFWSSSDVQTLRSRTLPRNFT